MKKPFVDLELAKEMDAKLEPYKEKAQYLIEHFSRKFWKFDRTNNTYLYYEYGLAHILYLYDVKKFPGWETSRIEQLADSLGIKPEELTAGPPLPF